MRFHHTYYYVQFVFNQLFGSQQKEINKEIAASVLENILKEQEAIFFNYRSFLTDYQRQLLRVTPHKNPVSAFTSYTSITKYDLRTSYSANRAVDPLIPKSLIAEVAEKISSASRMACRIATGILIIRPCHLSVS